MPKHLFKTLWFTFMLAGCAVNPVPAPQSKITTLSTLLYALNTQIPKKESLKLSRDIFKKTTELTKEFDLTSPPLWHNTLVNIGLREKGLCYHWSDTLYLHLKKKEYKHFSFHLVGANIGEYLFEHNALVVVKKGGKIENGVVVDPWRDSGKLYFSKVKEDETYIWSHRPERGCRTTR